ncbi:MAG: glycosyltransferase family 2 protein [Candidatus Nanopelagicales bacterium]|nr:glycosyltransferase family 2 protein [Candidatus Nanopelagicales bacterium]MCF8557990.1 glycosyltransferase family 2 protein [Candidatus Nanopelagicales bacterium]
MEQPTAVARKLVSIVFCAFNESGSVLPLIAELQKVAATEPAYDFEFVGIENGSIDDTFTELESAAREDTRVRVIQLSRNFRLDGGLTAGLDAARGDACVLMAADLEDPPELIHTFLRYWEQGYENVYGIVRERPGVPWLRRMNSKMFYALASRLSGRTLPVGASDFRLVDRVAVDSVVQMRERNRFVRGLFAWIGFRSIGVPFDRDQRFAGVSQAHSMKVLDLAVKGILAHSFIPLRLITAVGLLIFALSLIAIPLFAIVWIVNGVPFAGYGTIVALVGLGFGALSLMLGVIAEYVALIYEETKQRPLYLVRQELHFGD